MIQVYVSQACPNCNRLLSALRNIASLRGHINVVDIDRLPPSQRAGLQAVPTLVDEGRTYVGTEAFEWMKKYDAEVELDPAQLGSTLAFADLSGGGELQYAESFGAFTPLP